MLTCWLRRRREPGKKCVWERAWSLRRGPDSSILQALCPQTAPGIRKAGSDRPAWLEPSANWCLLPRSNRLPYKSANRCSCAGACLFGCCRGFTIISPTLRGQIKEDGVQGSPRFCFPGVCLFNFHCSLLIICFSLLNLLTLT